MSASGRPFCRSRTGLYKGLGPPVFAVAVLPVRAACACGTAARSRRELPQRGPMTQGPWSAPRARIENNESARSGQRTSQGFAGEVGSLAQPLTTIMWKNIAYGLGLSPMRRVVTGSTPPVTTRVLASETTVLGDIGAAWCATVPGSRKCQRWRLMRVLASSDTVTGGVYQPRGTQRRA